MVLEKNGEIVLFFMYALLPVRLKRNPRNPSRLSVSQGTYILLLHRNRMHPKNVSDLKQHFLCYQKHTPTIHAQCSLIRQFPPPRISCSQELCPTEFILPPGLSMIKEMGYSCPQWKPTASWIASRLLVSIIDSTFYQLSLPPKTIAKIQY